VAIGGRGTLYGAVVGAFLVNFARTYFGTPRALAASAFNLRRRECELAAQALGAPSLREVDDLERVARLPAPLDRRARHVVTENRRVLMAAHRSAPEFGQLMNASHASLRDDFEVSVPPLDVLVQCLQEHRQVFGARLTGAGFGGACVALVRSGAQLRWRRTCCAGTPPWVTGAHASFSFGEFTSGPSRPATRPATSLQPLLHRSRVSGFDPLRPATTGSHESSGQRFRSAR
jgi:hypothetical protein